MVARIAIPNLEAKALLIQIADPIIANQAHLAVVTVGRRRPARLANRLANRMVCKKIVQLCISLIPFTSLPNPNNMTRFTNLLAQR